MEEEEGILGRGSACAKQQEALGEPFEDLWGHVERDRGEGGTPKSRSVARVHFPALLAVALGPRARGWQ